MNKYVERLQKLLSQASRISIIGDSVPAYRFSLNQIAEIQDLQYEESVGRYLEKGFKTQTAEECRKHLQLQLGDDITNFANSFGTPLDPSFYTTPIMPVMVGAGEASSIYAGGGLPADIVDKKATTMVLQGAEFDAGVDITFWTDEKREMLKEAAVETGLNDEAGDRIRDAYLYGGSILYPILKGDSPSRFLAKKDRMRLEKGCIVRWTGVDRWNTVFVPSYIPTAADYLTPRTVMVLQESVEVSTSRMCIIRPKSMPYWSAIVNLGWSPSDICGWITAYYAYEITQKMLPVLAQQQSLLLYRMPLDALNATVGVNQVDKLMQVNEEQMKSWSSLSPKAVNMVGEVEVVDRTYSGLNELLSALKADLAAQSEIPEPSLWHTPNKGFSDNTQESLIKQSESLQMRQHYIERYMQNAKDLLIAHCWGTDSEEWKQRDTIQLRFSKPDITTEKDLADVGAKYSASINSLVQAGFTPDLATTVAKQFFPKVEVSEEQVAQIKKAYEERVADLKMGQTSVGGQGMNTQKPKEQKPRQPNGARVK